jgi:flagella basal body P-ring formation protein FlgA
MNMFRPFTTTLIAAIAAGWSVAAIAAPQLRTPIVVEGPELTLGHIFEDAGDAESVRVGPSPQPGERTVLRPSQLARFAKQHGLDWTPGPAVNVVVVRRASTSLAFEDVEFVLRQELQHEGLEGRFDLDVRNRAFNVALPVDSPYDLTVSNLSFDRASGRFTALLKVFGPEFAAQESVIDGTAHALVEIPVLTRNIAKGEVVGDADVIWNEVRESDVRLATVRDLEGLVGQEAKRLLRANAPIRSNDVWPPRLVRKGDLVTLTVQTKYMLLQTNGQAVEDGARGEVVRVVNLKSRKTVQGIVSGDGEIVIPFSNASQLAVN